MKKVLFFGLFLTSSYLHAQLGINTPDATSTLTVNGSISGKYKEVRASNYQIQQDDYNIAYLGGNESKGTFVLPKVKNGSIDFTGRIYYIKNLSQNKTLQIKAADSESIRFGGALDAKASIDLLPGRFVAIMANNSTGQSTWDLNIQGLEETPPEVKTVEYLKTSMPLNRTYDINNGQSVVQLGNLKIGYHSFNTTQGQLMFKLDKNDYALSVNSRIDFRSTLVVGSKTSYPLQSNVWNVLKLSEHYDGLLKTENQEVFIVTLIAYNTQEIYRITVYTVPELSHPGIPNFTTPVLVYFIEKVA